MDGWMENLGYQTWAWFGILQGNYFIAAYIFAICREKSGFLHCVTPNEVSISFSTNLASLADAPLPFDTLKS